MQQPPLTPDLITVMENDHKVQLQLCNDLEFVARNLGEHVDRALVAALAAQLRTGWLEHLRLEEDILYPLLRQRLEQTPKLKATPQLASMLDHVKREYDLDLALTDRIAEALEVLSAGGEAVRPELLRPMLRLFAGLQRHHIAWEAEIVLPLARQILLREDLHELGAHLHERHKTLEVPFSQPGATASLLMEPDG